MSRSGGELLCTGEDLQSGDLQLACAHAAHLDTPALLIARPVLPLVSVPVLLLDFFVASFEVRTFLICTGLAISVCLSFRIVLCRPGFNFVTDRDARV